MRRTVLAALCVAAVVQAAPARAQQAPIGEAWPSSPTAPSTQVNPRRVHDVRPGMLVLGGMLAGVGWIGAITWGAFTIDDIRLGDPTCSDLYGGSLFVPWVGPGIGLGAGQACLDGSGQDLQVWDIVVPVLTMAAQLGGLVPLVLGLLGGERIEFEGPYEEPLRVAIGPGPSLRIEGRL